MSDCWRPRPLRTAAVRSRPDLNLEPQSSQQRKPEQGQHIKPHTSTAGLILLSHFCSQALRPSISIWWPLRSRESLETAFCCIQLNDLIMNECFQQHLLMSSQPIHGHPSETCTAVCTKGYPRSMDVTSIAPLDFSHQLCLKCGTMDCFGEADAACADAWASIARTPARSAESCHQLPGTSDV